MKNPENFNPKEQQWQQALAHVETITDGLGKTIDEGIKEGVAALNVLGINTSGSCEGHEGEWGTGGPYIDVESGEIEALNKEFEKLAQENTIESEARLDEVRKEITVKNLQERRKLIPLLEEFYKNRDVPYEIQIGIKKLAFGWSRLESQGVDFQETETDEEVKNQRLADFQREMREFTESLKETFFSN